MTQTKKAPENPGRFNYGAVSFGLMVILLVLWVSMEMKQRLQRM